MCGGMDQWSYQTKALQRDYWDSAASFKETLGTRLGVEEQEKRLSKTHLHENTV